MSFSEPYISHFSQHSSSVFFFAQTLHTFYKGSPSKCKFSDFPLFGLKFTNFLMSFFKQKVSFSSKFGSFFSVMRDNSSVLFYLKLYMLLRKVAHQSANFRLATGHIKIHQILHVIFGTKESVFLQTLNTLQCREA